MNRRTFLASAGALAGAGLAGCLGSIERRSAYAPPVVEDRPDAVYHPSHVEEVATVGVRAVGPYGCALMYTYPHRFWLVTGARTERVSIQSTDTVHLMATVWDRGTGTVLPDASPTLSITAAGASVTTVNPWSMLSQPMGLHFGANVTLPGEGSYEIALSSAAPSVPRYGAVATPDEGARCSFSFEYTRADRDALSVTRFPEKQGTRAALAPMAMGPVPLSRAPSADALPGRVLGTATSGDADFVVTVLDDATRFGGTPDQQYLAVSPRTPYNDNALSFVGLSTTVDRDGATVVDARLSDALDDRLGHHYGLVVDALQAGDELTLSVDTPPQLSRHEGYETAFLEMPPMQFSV